LLRIDHLNLEADNRMETLMRMQSSYDIARTRAREKLITVRRYRRFAA
jgi:plasmid maintenance system antidote protein VapI